MVVVFSVYRSVASTVQSPTGSLKATGRSQSCPRPSTINSLLSHSATSPAGVLTRTRTACRPAAPGTVAVKRRTCPRAARAAGLHAVRVRVRTPAGEVAEWLNRELMVDGRGQGCDLPVAFNDPVGRWTVEATDLYTDKTTTTRYRVK